MNNAPLYSLDTSALIELKDKYPPEIFESMWDYITNLGHQGRLIVADPVKGECKDEVLTKWFGKCNKIIIPVYGDLNIYMNITISQLQNEGISLFDPNSTKNRVDPFVIAAALMIEKRDISNLRKTTSLTCKVISYEKRANPGARLSKIPDVCDYYNIEHLSWIEMLKNESWRC